MINKAVLTLMEGSRRFGRLLPWKGRGHWAANAGNYLAVRGTRELYGFVEDQNSLAGLRYGLTSMRWSGCGPIAAANALFALGREAYLPDVIYELEEDGAVLFGAGGTAPWAVRDFMARRRLSVRLSTKEEEFDGMLRAGRVFILLFVFDRRRILNLHYVCMEKKESGFEVHNLDSRGRAVRVEGTFETILGSLTGGRGRSLMLMDIGGDNLVNSKSNLEKFGTDTYNNTNGFFSLHN